MHMEEIELECYFKKLIFSNLYYPLNAWQTICLITPSMNEG